MKNLRTPTKSSEASFTNRMVKRWKRNIHTLKNIEEKESFVKDNAKSETKTNKQAKSSTQHPGKLGHHKKIISESNGR